VGIGTSSPSQALTVLGDARATGNLLAGYGTPTAPTYRFGPSPSEDTGLSSPFGETLSMITNAVERIRINSSGNVGIGTSFPNARLHVVSGSGDLLRAGATSTATFRITSTGRVVTTALQITGGGDLVEGFETSGKALEPGTVVIIDPDNAGELLESRTAYDSKVAGVISGANGIQHGIRMGQHDVLDGDTLLAMAGRVYVKCSTENGPIRPGDLLTTAGLAGHAMKATAPDRAFGAVIGKAMSVLEDETGLVLVLVSLQ